MSKSSGTSSRKSVVAVEIGSDWVKVAHCEAMRGGMGLSRLCLERVGTIDSTHCADVLSQAFRDQRFPRGRVIGYVPRQMVTIRMLELPSVDAGEIADMVDLQAGKQTPYSKDEIVSDYMAIGPGREGYTKVMLVIVQRSVVRQRFHIMEEAGLEIERMSVSTEGLANWFRLAEAGQGIAPTVVLDVDSFYTDVAVISGGNVGFTRSVLIGANQLIEEPDRWREKFAREVKRSLEVCQTESPGLTPGRIVVTGAGPNVVGLADYLGKELNLPATDVDALAAVKRVPKEPDPRSPDFRCVSLVPLLGMVAPGALQFNLVPDSVSLRRTLLEKAKSLTALGMLLMALLVSASAATSVGLVCKRDRLAALETEFARGEPTVREIERKHEVIRVVRERMNSRFDVVRILPELHKRVPAGMYFDSVAINVRDGNMTLEGTAASRRDVRTLVENLQESSFFADVRQEGSAVQDRSGRFKFKIVCPLDVQR